MRNTGGRATRMATYRALRLVRTVNHLTVEAGNLCVWCVCVVVVGAVWLWLWVERGAGFDIFYFPSLEREPVGGHKKASFLDRRKHQSKPNTKGERQRMHLSQTRGDDAGRRADIAHASAGTVVRTRACVHLCAAPTLSLQRGCNGKRT